MSSETWKKEVTVQRGEYSARLKQVRHINEKESLSWPTATQGDPEGGSQKDRIEMTNSGFKLRKKNKPDITYGAKLRDAVEYHEDKNWPTPRAGNPGSRKKGTGGKVLNEEVKNWATPQAMDGRSDVRKPEERSEKAKKSGCSNLREQVHNWATPNTLDHLPPKEGEAMQRLYDTHRKGRKSPSNLREQVNPKSYPNTLQDQDKSSTSGKSQESWATPTQGLGMQGTPGNQGRSLVKDLKIKTTSRLNPNWVEQLMGLPVGWTQLPTEWTG